MAAILLLVVLALVSGLLDRNLGLADQYGGSVRSPSLTLADQAERYGDHFTPYAILRSSAPGSAFVLHPDAAPVLSAARLYALAEARDVQMQAILSPAQRDGEPDRTIEHAGRLWSFWFGDRSVGSEFTVDVVLTQNEREEVRIVQRHGDGTTGDGSSPVDAGDEGVPWASFAAGSAGWAEAVLYLGLVLFGGLVIPRGSSIPRFARPPLAFIMGMAVIGALGIARLPGVATLLVGILILILLGRGVGPARFAWTTADVFPLVTFAAFVVGIALTARQVGTVVVSLDSFDYLVEAHELAEGRLLSSDLSLKRGGFLQGLYAVGFGIGLDFMAVPGVIALFAATVVIGVYGISRCKSTSARMAVIGLAALPWFHVQIVSLARYVNTHVILAVVLLSLAVLVHWQAKAAEQVQVAFAPSVMIAAAAPVLMRAEGMLLVALFLLGASRADPGRQSAAWRALGVSTFVWSASLALGGQSSGSGEARLFIAYLAMGVAFMLLPIVARRAPILVHRAPGILMTLLWVWTLTLITGITGRAASFTNSVVANLAEGQGRWGILAPVLALLALLVLGHRSDPTEGAGVTGARLLVAGFVPVSLAAKLGDGAFGANQTFINWLLTSGGGGRVGWGDSMNRMWTHIALVIIFLAVSLVVQRTSKTSITTQGRSATQDRTPHSRMIVFAALTAFVAALWNPRYLPADQALVNVERTVVGGLRVSGDAVVGELVEGHVIEQIFFLDQWEGDSGHTPSSVCAGLTFVTFGRQNVGDVTIALTLGEFSSAETIAAAEISDWGIEEFCLALPTELQADEPGLLRIEGRGGVSGQSVSLLSADQALSTTSGFLPPAVIFDPGDRLGTPLSGPIAVELRLVAERRPASIAVDRLLSQTGPRAIPAVIATLILGIFVQSTRSSRRLPSASV